MDNMRIKCDICKKYNLKLILDAAHMAGTQVREMSPEGSGFSSWHVGKFADASYAASTWGCVVPGGLIPCALAFR